MSQVSFGKYTLIEKLTTGGMAEVFRAAVTGPAGFRRIVAIKKILPCYADNPEFIRMFVDEASIAARLNHANIAQIYEFDIVDGTPYIAMEFVEGKDLRAVLSRCASNGVRIPFPLAVYIALEIAKGLYYVHSRREASKPLNIVHRDVSPQNIMISHAGEVKLVDFGIARAVNRLSSTYAGTVKGKYAYMSPEQVMGARVDHRSDIFSLGIVLWEMLTLRRLFAGDSEVATISNVLKRKVLPCHEVCPDVPETLSPLVLKALERNPDSRYPSMLVMYETLSRFLFDNGCYPGVEGLARFIKELFPEEMERLAQGEHLTFETTQERESGLPPLKEVLDTSDAVRDILREESEAQTRLSRKIAMFTQKPKSRRRAFAAFSALAATLGLLALMGWELWKSAGVVTPSASSTAAPAVVPKTEAAQTEEESPSTGEGPNPGVDRPATKSSTNQAVGRQVAAVAATATEGPRWLDFKGADVMSDVPETPEVWQVFPGPGQETATSSGVGGTEVPYAPVVSDILAPKNVKFTILVDPPDARIRIGEDLLVPGEITLPVEEGSPVRIQVFKGGYSSVQDEFEVRSGLVKRYRLKESAYLEIFVEPPLPTAQVLVNGKPPEGGRKGRYGFSGVMGERVRLEVSASGWETWVEEVILTKKNNKKIVRLKKPGVRILRDHISRAGRSDDTTKADRFAKSEKSKKFHKSSKNHLKVSAKDNKDRENKAGSEAALPTGFVTVQARPYAEVLYKGKPWGTTPIIGKEVPAGAHEFTLKYLDKTHTCRVRVEPGSKALCSHDFINQDQP